MATTAEILERIRILVAELEESQELAPANAFDPVTVLNSISSRENHIEAADGIQSIVFSNQDAAATFTLNYDAANDVMTLQNLTTGESQGVAIGSTAIANNASEAIEFGGLGITVTINSAFDKTADIIDEGGAASATGGSIGSIDTDSFNITNIDLAVLTRLNSDSGTIDGTTSSASVIAIDGFSGTFVGTAGQKAVTLTDGTDSFALEFSIITSLADGDDFDISLNGLGTLFGVTPHPPIVRTAVEGGEILVGGSLGDRLTGGIGDDTLLGGAGNDVFLGLEGRDVFVGGAGVDTLDLSAESRSIVLRLDTSVVRNTDNDSARITGVENATGGIGDDLMRGDSANNRLIGRSGDDTILGGDGNDALFGNSGDDILRGGNGIDMMSGASGADILIGGAGDDIMHGGAGDDIGAGGDGNDRFNGGAGDDRAYGQAGDDTLRGEAGSDMLRGGAGDDIIDGGDGNDIMKGDAGADIMTGGAGFDRMFGGAGADTFVLTDGFGFDRIFDFEDTIDRMDFSGHTGVVDIADLAISAFNAGADTKIVLATDPTGPDFIVLMGVTSGDISTADFIF